MLMFVIIEGLFWRWKTDFALGDRHPPRNFSELKLLHLPQGKNFRGCFNLLSPNQQLSRIRQRKFSP